ncbi:patatin-like phospholipase family protein [Amantichitinum ursilacus]|uniref:Patatin-like phospholipase n=1 Tax=Amantichitinum ursilacus TaxID=857265 RepID=A0A0N1JSG1_9NEIS|nr:patatin-like phospholipase family protein [Amantichitinum ursilacus]KPC52656.1 Patatin-like phospholipase [Amantichitinum ursilacus]
MTSPIPETSSAAQAAVCKAQPAALILSGGGARAAYQVGVLLAIARLWPVGAGNPFPIVCGTSAGAINAAALAARAGDFHGAVRHLGNSWLKLTPDQVYLSSAWALGKSALHWAASLLLGGLGKRNPRSLLDNQPLRQMLAALVDFPGIGAAVQRGDLSALSITVSGYTSGQSVSFFEGAADHANWQRASRLGVREKIELDHLMASSAIPLVFPAVRLHREYFGDGSVRQIAPISPAIHLGAQRILVIGVAPQRELPPREKVQDYPSLAQVAGHLLNSVFLDAMETDLERVQRVNRTVGLLPEHALAAHQTDLHALDVLTIAPSRPLEKLAMPHRNTFPPGLRFMLRGLGAFRRNGSVLASYLLFHHDYVRQLIRLGYRDAMHQRHALREFLGIAARSD